MGNVSRIAILGGAGTGKSTLARALGERLELTVIHLDRLVFGPGWAPVEPEAVRQALAASLAGGRAAGGWIVEGTYPMLADLYLPQADLILWLEQPAWLRLWRSWRKTVNHRGRPRADRPDGCEEAFGPGYVGAVLSFGRWSRAVGEALATSSGGRAVTRLKGDRAAACFVKSLAR